MLPGLVISAASLALVFYLADVDRLAVALQMADYRYIALVGGISLVWLGVRAAAWRTLLHEKASLGQVFLTINEGYLLNNLLPFRLGEVGRAFLLSRKTELRFWQIFSTILIERALDVAMAAGLLFFSLPFVVGASWAQQAAIMAGSLVLVGLGALYLLARYREWAIGQFDKLTPRWPPLQRIGQTHLRAFLSGLAVLTEGGRFLKAIGWMALNWVVGILQYYALLKAFFPQGELLWAVFSLGVVALGIAAPSSPGAVGVLELSMVGALSLFNLDASASLAMALTGHLMNYLVTGLFGAYALARDGMTLTGLYKTVKEITPGGD